MDGTDKDKNIAVEIRTICGMKDLKVEKNTYGWHDDYIHVTRA